MQATTTWLPSHLAMDFRYAFYIQKLCLCNLLEASLMHPLGWAQHAISTPHNYKPPPGPRQILVLRLLCYASIFVDIGRKLQATTTWLPSHLAMDSQPLPAKSKEIIRKCTSDGRKLQATTTFHNQNPPAIVNPPCHASLTETRRASCTSLSSSNSQDLQSIRNDTKSLCKTYQFERFWKAV